MPKHITNTPQETEALGAKLSSRLKAGDVVALYGGLGMGKTAFVRGMAAGLGLDSTQVSSPTFALVNDYGGNPPLIHFDMYRISVWEDQYSTGFFDYMDDGTILAVEWSENIENALPEHSIRVSFSRLSDNQREIDIDREL